MNTSKIRRVQRIFSVLKRENGDKVGTVVPNHSELKIGTLKGILALAKVSEEEFAEYQ